MKRAKPGLGSVGGSQEWKVAGDCLEGAGFRLGDSKSERREDCGLGVLARFVNMLLIWLVQ